MKVYAIQPKYDVYKGYLVSDAEQARISHSSARCKGQPLDWPEPLKVVADEEDVGIPEADIGMLAVGSLVFTEGAYSELEEIAARYGQLLPLQYGERRLWLWNITNVADVLDRSRSDFNDFGGVSHPVFTAEKLTDNPVFKLREDNYTGIYCTDTFRQLIENHNFTGVEFEALDVA